LALVGFSCYSLSLHSLPLRQSLHSLAVVVVAVLWVVVVVVVWAVAVFELKVPRHSFACDPSEAMDNLQSVNH